MTNIKISDDSPTDYFNDYEKFSNEDINMVLENHALPRNFYEMEYTDFLTERRKLMAEYIRKYFESI